MALYLFVHHGYEFPSAKLLLFLHPQQSGLYGFNPRRQPIALPGRTPRASFMMRYQDRRSLACLAVRPAADATHAMHH